MAMITCHECGKQISNTASVCPHCGAKVNQISIKSDSSSTILIIYGVLILLGAIICFTGLGLFFNGIDAPEVLITAGIGFVMCMFGTYRTFKSVSFFASGKDPQATPIPSAPAMFCPACGTRNSSAAKYCSKCGASLSNTADTHVSDE